MVPLLKNDLSLSYLEHEPLDLKLSEAPLVIFLHGKGANETDLFDLAPRLGSQFRVLCLRAPLLMGKKSYGWFHSVRSKQDEYIYDTEEVLNVLEKVFKFIKEVQDKYQVQSQNCFLLGFSQGGMLALGIATNYPKSVGGVIGLSCALLPEFRLKSSLSKKLFDFPILLSHGVDDDILNVHYGREAYRYLKSAGALVSYFEYPLGHDVTDVNFLDVIRWFQQRDNIT